jgi:hypothetical protein
MNELERNCKLALWRLARNNNKLPVIEDDLGRELIITPFDGCYGQAGLVMTINGSPPRAIAVVQTYHKRLQTIWVMRRQGRNGATRIPMDMLCHNIAAWKREAALDIRAYLIACGQVDDPYRLP